MSSPSSATEPDTPTQINLQLFRETRVTTRQRRVIEIDIHRRCYIYALREYGRWTIRKISRTLCIPRSTVHRICQRGPNDLAPRYRSGRPSLITPTIRRRLIEIATASSQNRRLPLASIARLAGIRASSKALRQAFHIEGYHRRIARQKPFLNALAKQRRLEWAESRVYWTVEDWRKVIWTDESAFNIGGSHGNVWITRKPGEQDMEDCLIPKFRKLSLLMVWGAISGCGGKQMLSFWDKSWGKITAITYTNHILIPLLVPIYHSQHLFYGDTAFVMEDKAPVHTARYTQAARIEHGIPSLPWPASSSDLNPIEEVWRRMKDFLYHLDERPTTVPTMRAAVEDAWRSITNEEIREIVDTMPARVQAVIAARGGHTRY